MAVWLALARHDDASAPGPAPAWLSAGEQRRLAALTAPRRRAQFLAGHRLARALLAAVGGGIWTDWTIEDDDGRPVITGAPAAAGEGWTLSLTHSGDRVACAVTRGLRAGIDLEQPGRPRDLERLLAFVCSPGERARLDALVGTTREQAFRIVWTLKEAWFKQRGEGLAPARLATLHTEPAARQAQAWTWQCGDAALAVVAPGVDQPPQWVTPEGGEAGWTMRPDGWRIVQDDRAPGRPDATS